MPTSQREALQDDKLHSIFYEGIRISHQHRDVLTKKLSSHNIGTNSYSQLYYHVVSRARPILRERVWLHAIHQFVQ